MFYTLFNSSSDNSRRERAWIMGVLVDGLETAEDYKLYRRRHVIPLCMSLYGSTVCDAGARSMILEVCWHRMMKF
jgi:hypothetical protein